MINLNFHKLKFKNLKRFINTKKTYILIVVLILAIIYAVLATIDFRPFKNYNTKMTEMVKQYYETNIKGKVIGVNRQLVTIDMLKDSGLNIGILNDCNREDSKSYVIIYDPKETDLDKITYTVENHLTCPGFSNDR